MKGTTLAKPFEEVTNKKQSKSINSLEYMSPIVDAVISIVLTRRVHVTKQPSGSEDLPDLP
jgi:hypothetical protein